MKKTILVALALFVSTAFAGNDKNYTYLALGDSVPFGLNILLLPPFTTKVPSPYDFTGYPEFVAAAEHLDKSKKEVNGSCPGETSGSFLDFNSMDLGCNSPRMQPPPLPAIPPFKPYFGLRADYTGSQMDWAVTQLASNKHINLVTLSIGANDVLAVLPKMQACTDPICAQSILAGALQSYAENLAKILTGIRAVYQGKLVLVKYYSPLSTPPFDLDGIAIALNGTMQGVADYLAMADPHFVPVRFADGFTAFKVASALHGGDACQAGLVVPLPPAQGQPPCDFHPTPKGQEVLAATVESVLK